MKKTLLVFLLSLLLFFNNSMAQNWLTSGNTLAANGTLGTTTNFSILFKSNNSERGRLTNTGLWGFGTTAPNSKMHINSAAGVNAFRAQVNGTTKLLVHSGGGVSIGSSTIPPTNGLYVAGSVGIGVSTLLAGKLDVRTTSNNTAIYASADQGNGVRGFSTAGYGVVGNSNQGTGVYGYSNNVGVK